MICGLTLIFAIVIHLIFSEFINNPYLIEADRARGIDDPLGADIPLSMGLPFLIILFFLLYIHSSARFPCGSVLSADKRKIRFRRFLRSGYPRIHD